MNDFKINQNGVTLLELLVAISITVLIMGGAWKLMQTIFTSNLKISQGNQVFTNLSQAYEQITRIGRLAQACGKYYPPGALVATGLQCSVDFDATGLPIAAANARFLMGPANIGKSLLYQKLQNVVANQNWATQLVYDGIDGLDVCDVSDMTNGAHSCPMNSQDGTGRGSFLTSNPSFFRFRLRAPSYTGETFLNGSFFVRSASLSVEAGIHYDWAGFTQ